DRRRSDEILLAVGRFEAPTIKVRLSAVSLDGSRSTGKSCSRIERKGVVDREGVVRVGACRDRSRLVGRMCRVSPARRTSRRLSPVAEEEAPRPGRLSLDDDCRSYQFEMW